MALLDISRALFRSCSSRRISPWISLISQLLRLRGVILRSSRNNCSFSWNSRRRSLSLSAWPGAMDSSRSANCCCMDCTRLRASSYSSRMRAISASRVPIGTSCNTPQFLLYKFYNNYQLDSDIEVPQL